MKTYAEKYDFYLHPLAGLDYCGAVLDRQESVTC